MKLELNIKKLHRFKPNADIRSVFDEAFRADLGEHAERAWQICVDLGELAAGVMYIFDRAIERNKLYALRVDQTLTALEKFCREHVQGKSLPPLSEMGSEQEGELARELFLIYGCALL